ncbi:neprilysin-2-like [Planococcus citri]|uniref:neprilysin-2-like n=1 Tax=Planococcus citri TaxID=170843 RepID=UPI0031F7FF3F
MPKGINCIFLVCLCVIISQGKFEVSCGDVCNTDGCVKTAELLQQSMDMNVDPCEDFYSFACGGFISDTEIPKNTLGINSFSIIREKTFEQIHEILSETIHEGDIEPFRIAKQFFKDCLDEETISTHGLQPIADKIQELGGWPVAEDVWNGDEFSWIDVVGKSRQMGFASNYILSFDIETNLLNSSSRVIYVSPPDLALPVYNLRAGIDDSKVKLYFKLMLNLATKFQVPIKKALVELASALQFEIKLAQYFPTVSDKKEDIAKTFLAMSISEAQQRYPSIEWMHFIRSMLNPSVSVSESETIVIAYPEFITNVQGLLESTSKRTLANYFIWRTLFFSLNSYLIVSDSPRWKSCVAVTADKMNLAVASMYVRKYFSDERKKNTIAISKSIKGKMHETLSNCYWIDEATKKHALEKINAMTENVGYPDILLSNEQLTQIYEGLQVHPGQYYESLLTIKKFIIDFTISTLKRPVIKDDWLSYENPLIVNAFYALPENSIKIPVALLQRNVFLQDRPNYLNYGAIGFILGHELSHAFDDQGSTFDKDGNFRNWWPEETKSKYYEKVKCFVKQYDNYLIEGTENYVDGLITQGENIADNEGIRQAYRAYEEWERNNGPEPRLPGLDYTPRQLFWISAANVWCSKYASVYLSLTVNEDLHAPDKIRILGSFSNQREFSRDFACPADSSMNPSKKCSMWD